MVTTNFKEENDYIEISVSEGNVTSSIRVFRKDIEKYRRGELQNDPMIMSESVVKQALKDQIARNNES